MRERKCRLTLGEVLPQIDTDPKYSNKKRSIFAGESVKISSLRLHTFKEKGCSCVKCGRQATFFTLERTTATSPWNLELYGVYDDTEVLFTKDHVQPRSLGGKNHISNMQTMCVECNLAKGNTEAGKPNISGGRTCKNCGFGPRSMGEGLSCDMFCGEIDSAQPSLWEAT